MEKDYDESEKILKEASKFIDVNLLDVEKARDELRLLDIDDNSLYKLENLDNDKEEEEEYKKTA